MRPSAKRMRSLQRRRLAPFVAMGIGTMVVLAAIYGARLLMARPHMARNTGSEPSAVASIVGEPPTTVIVSTPNRDECRRYQLNVATGERGDRGLGDCDAESGNRPGRLEAISRAFRNR